MRCTKISISLGHMEVQKKQRYSDEHVKSAEKQITEYQEHFKMYETSYSVEFLKNKLEKQSFVMPTYRNTSTWSIDKKSKFIESLLVGIPISFLSFWMNPVSGKFEILDGCQRLITIREFLNNDLTLGELSKLPSCVGFKYKDFKFSRQQKLNRQNIRANILYAELNEKLRAELYQIITVGR